MRRAGYLFPASLAACIPLAAVVAFLVGPLRTGATQNPRLSLDMDPASNGYNPATNTMTVGSVDSCLASPTANPGTHSHTADVVVENVEDLVGWQVRLNYNGDEMRPTNVDFDPFLDTATGQEMSFLNLPRDAPGRHRDVVSADSETTGSLVPNTRSFGSAYYGPYTAPLSPDTPHKKPPDDASYDAPSGGVLARIDLEVTGDQSGRTLFIDR